MPMMNFLDNAKRYLWSFVELGFISILAIMLIYLILGQGSGVFVLAVADNVTKFAQAVPTPSLIGLALLLALIYLIMQRVKESPRDQGGPPRR
jgi:nitrate reductase gamma subunit